jgi:hypothetical protein
MTVWIMTLRNLIYWKQSLVRNILYPSIDVDVDTKSTTIHGVITTNRTFTIVYTSDLVRMTSATFTFRSLQEFRI